jgi:hypothetical protein
VVASVKGEEGMGNGEELLVCEGFIFICVGKYSAIT